jgi:voltage-gated potassium channel
MHAILRSLLAPGSRFGMLLTSLVVMLFLPFVLPAGLNAILSPLFFTVVLLSSLSAVADTRRHVVIGTALAVPGCVLIITGSVTQIPTVTVLSEIVALGFLAYVAVTILVYVLRARQVDLGIVLGSVCVYLMVALMWGLGFDLIERWQPGSFAVPPLAEGERMRNALQYFSFVTITTLGYGDIQPVTAYARLVSVMEAVVGQLYLVVLVARLVGLHTALESKRLEG